MANNEEPIFTDDEIKHWVMDEAALPFSGSFVCCGIYGLDGTGKSGIVLDCRSDEEKRAGLKVYVLDFDGGCAPVKKMFHNDDPNLLLLNPVEKESGIVDYKKTIAKTKALLWHIANQKDVKAVVIDGMDTLLRFCEFSMADVGFEADDFRYWRLRNKIFSDVFSQAKLVRADVFCVTHQKFEQQTGEVVADWERKTPDQLWQVVRTFRETKQSDKGTVITLKAEIVKAKDNLNLVGKVFTVAEITHYVDEYNRLKSDARWFGLRFVGNDVVQRT